jgi:membrane-bound serine protease (ClpP class)
MNILQDPTLISPNIIYLLLMVGLWLSATGTYIPGTGIIEISGAGLILLTLYLLTLVSTNWVALVLVIVGALVFFMLPLFKPEWIRIAEGGLVVQAVASFLLFSDSTVSPVLILTGVLLAWFYHRTILKAILKQHHQLSSTQKDAFLVGAQGRVVAPIDNQGTVHVKGELWTARSTSRLESGTDVVVTEQDGLELKVEKLKRDTKTNTDES